MLVRVHFAKINGEKVSGQGNFAIFSVSNGFTLFKIFDDIHSGMKVLFLLLVFSELSYLCNLRKGIFHFLVFSRVLYANKQKKKHEKQNTLHLQSCLKRFFS